MCNDENENARVGYQVATSLMMGQSQLFWSKFNALIVANSIIILAVVTMVGDINKFDVIWPRIAAAVGMILNLIAIFMLNRSRKHHDHWKNKVVSFEKTIKQIDTVSTSLPDFLLSVKKAAVIILLLFVVVYIAMICWAL